MHAEQTRRVDLHPRLIYELTRAVSAATDLDGILAAALDCLNGSLDVDRSSILLFGEDGRMHFRAWRGLSESYRAAVDGHSPWTQETLDPPPVLVQDVLEAPDLTSLRSVIEAEEIRSLAFFPLLAESRLLGKFMVYRAEPHEFSEAEVMVAQTIAAQVAFALDQQERRDAHQRLEALNRAVIDALGVAVYTTDAEGVITRYNSAAAALWGRHPVVGRDMWCGSWRLYYPDGRPMAHEECPMGVALKEQRAVRGEEIIVENPDGSRHMVMPYPSPVHDFAGRLIGAINVLVDVTDQAETRAALEAALLAKDDFLGQVSHELRTPLTQLVGNAHLLTRRWNSLDDDTRQESLMEMMAQSQRMQRLVDNMLVLSRLERGILPESEPHLIQRLIEPTVAEFVRRYPQAKLQASVRGDLPPVETNPSTIDQVLWNLLTNAHKYGPADGAITLEAKADADRVVVVVRDEGPGVSEGDLERLFQPYFRSANTAGQASGLGLGLSVCKTLVEIYGGEIWAKRMAPKGMEFGFALPAMAN